VTIDTSSSLATARAHYKITFAVLLIGITAYGLLQSLVLPVLPTIQHDLHTSQSTVTWVLTAYLLTASIFTPIIGRLGDMFGKKRLLVATLVILGLGTVVAALSTSIGVLIVGRAIQGVGGGVLPLAFGIIRDEFPPAKVSTGVGFTAAIVAVAAGAGIVLAGPIVSHLNYHWLFWLPLFMIAIGAVATHFFVPESPVRSPGRISWGAAVLLSGWLVALLLAVSEGASWGWASPAVIGLVTAAVVLCGWWIMVELRSKDPLVDMRMMRIPAVWTTNLVSFLFGMGMYAVLVFIPEFVQTPSSAGYGFSASIIQSGLFLLPLTVAMFVFGLLAGPMARAIGSKVSVVAGSTISSAAFVLLTVAHHQRWEIYLASTLLGSGLGLAFSAMSNLIVEAVPPGQTGIASGMNANIRTIGGSIGSAVTASIVTASVVGGSLPAESGYTRGFLFLAVATGAAAISSLFIPKSRPGKGAAPGPGHFDHAELAMVAGGTLTEG
jgi:EmrB/QacA subfamily drug resistance transporter